MVEVQRNGYLKGSCTVYSTSSPGFLYYWILAYKYSPRFESTRVEARGRVPKRPPLVFIYNSDDPASLLPEAKREIKKKNTRHVVLEPLGRVLTSKVSHFSELLEVRVCVVVVGTISMGKKRNSRK